ncbi:glycoside hydrolase family 32 protein [Dyadobacter psychrotolerans]|uniref:Glycoside hydrolase family 32 protein n=1 Tax=Dyadobacter psychrotolerans TaxID=2541721 RepID=A0A4R5DS41_9BACT|nr:glycoside hydrolase family 32 protein [Dyadobacter psychrotolerans]TDE13653.1 glycoside hydrolase family 32 protein [Dyadobacter psychrotolerans]
MIKKIITAAMIFIMMTCLQLTAQDFKEKYRPQFHFSPKAHWMNDPNGMVYHNGIYHLFYQYYPDAKVWGPMHWGHATSKDLFTWKEQPIALFPDSLGYIFSGSAVVDAKNTSGFGKDGKVPLVAIFTLHDPVQEKQKTGKHETQGIAYSLDDGKTWTKYKANPVLQNPGISDFRDPKVMWFEPQKKWIMTLATKDRITFYSSPDLKSWTSESNFGADAGAHGGVWECPDLFPIMHNGKKVWVLIVNINPGGPNKGSAGQYFLGDFDGKTFTAYSKETKWLDFGTDNYAAVTFSNTGNRNILLGWMSNWQYANQVPTDPWRSANTIARELGLKTVNKVIYLTSVPVKELDLLKVTSFDLKNVKVKDQLNLTEKANNKTGLFRLDFDLKNAGDFSIVLANKEGNELIVGYDKKANQYYIDRTKSGKSDFEKGFAEKHIAPRISVDANMTISLVADVASVELFADNGLTVMTDIFFPESVMTEFYIKSASGITIDKLKYTVLKASTK